MVEREKKIGRMRAREGGRDRGEEGWEREKEREGGGNSPNGHFSMS